MIDPLSAEWQELAAKIAAMRASQLEVLISRETPELGTQFSRGWIAALDELTKFVEEPPTPVDADPAAPY